MDIKNLADLAKIAALCRKKGIESLKIGPDGIEFKMGHEPSRASRKSARLLSDEASEPKPLSEEDILFWSSSAPEHGAGAN